MSNKNEPYRRYDVKVTDYKGRKLFRVKSNYYDRSDYAILGTDGKLTSYSDRAVEFVKDSIKGVEDILQKAEVGRSYTIYTDGVHGEPIGYVESDKKPSLMSALAAATEKSKHRESVQQYNTADKSIRKNNKER